MKSKILSLFALSVFALVLLVSSVSAIVLSPITVSTIPPTVNESAASFNIVFNLTNTNVAGGTLNFSASTVSVGSFSFDNNDIAGSATETVTATITLPADFSGDTISGIINATGVPMTISVTLPFTVNVIPSEVEASNLLGNDGQLEVKKIEFSNKGLQYTTFGEDGEWFPFEEIEAEITVKNSGDYDIANVL